MKFTKRISHTDMTSPQHLTDDIGLCYYDPEREELLEFTPESKIVLGAFERNVRRFYLVKPSELIKGGAYTYAVVTFKSTAPSVIVKSKAPEDYLTAAELFRDIDANNQTVIFFSHYTSEVMPLDVYIESKSPMGEEVELVVDIEVR